MPTAPEGTPATTPLPARSAACRAGSRSRRARSVALVALTAVSVSSASGTRCTVVGGHRRLGAVANDRHDGVSHTRDDAGKQFALLGCERVEHVFHQVAFTGRTSNTDAHAHELIGAPCVDQRLHALVPSRAALAPDLDLAHRKVGLIVHDDDIARRDPVLVGEVHRGATAQIHIRLRACGDDVEALDSSLAHSGRPFTTLAREAAAAFQLVQTHPTHIVPGARVLASTIAETDYQCGHGIAQLARRTASAPRP